MDIVYMKKFGRIKAFTTKVHDINLGGGKFLFISHAGIIDTFIY